MEITLIVITIIFMLSIIIYGFIAIHKILKSVNPILEKTDKDFTIDFLISNLSEYKKFTYDKNTMEYRKNKERIIHIENTIKYLKKI